MKLSPSFRELLASLSERNVRYLIVGGYAVAYHARPRYTKDIDLWIESEPNNILRLLEALQDFGFGSLGLAPEDFASPGQFVQLGYPPNRVDLLTSVPGLTFEEAWQNRAQEQLEGIALNLLSKEDLIRAKRAAGRYQDLADLEILEES